MPRDGSASREALLILTILRYIPRNRWISTTDLRTTLEEAGFSLEVRRLQRILASICQCPELGVERNGSGKPFGYRRSVPNNDLETTRLRPQESLLLRLAEEHLKYQIPGLLMKTLSPLFESARQTLNEVGTRGRQKEWLQKVAFVPNSIMLMPPKILPRIFNAVSEALYRDNKLEIEYRNLKGDCKKRTVSPLGLIQQEHRLYLICKFDNYDNLRHLALHRIKSASVLEFAADRPKDFSLQSYIASRHINYSNGKKVRFIIEFTDAMTRNVLEETPFNLTQKITELPDGAWRLEAIVDDTALLDGWVASWKQAAGIRYVEKAEMFFTDNHSSIRQQAREI